MTSTVVQDRAEEFYDQRWRECGDMRRYGPSARHTRRLVFRQLEGVAFGSLIDIGCGDGTFLREALDRYDVDVAYGADVSGRALELARRRVAGAADGVSTGFLQMDIGAGGFEPPDGVDGRFDLGVCSEVLEHVEDDRSALRTIGSMCDQVVFTVPAGAFRDEDRQVGHVRRYSRAEFREKVEAAGFDVVAIRSWGFPFYSPLYRILLEHTSLRSRRGEFGLARRAAAAALHQVFRLNVVDRGDRIVARAVRR